MARKDYETMVVRGRTYRVVDDIEDVPLAYEVWNIGRENFPVEGRVPMARMEGYSVVTSTLMAVKMPSESYAQEIMHRACRAGMTARKLRKELAKCEQ